jgi:hypothetical protein
MAPWCGTELAQGCIATTTESVTGVEMKENEAAWRKQQEIRALDARDRGV